MYITVKEASLLLEMKEPRLRDLLQKGRVKGAYKSGHYWLIPTYDGLPRISEGKRGPKGTWKTKRGLKTTRIHVNGQHIQDNQKVQKNKSKKEQYLKPVITIKANENFYAKSLEIPYPCRIIYQPHDPLKCGAVLWIEVLGDDLISIQPPCNLMKYQDIPKVNMEKF